MTDRSGRDPLPLVSEADVAHPMYRVRELVRPVEPPAGSAATVPADAGLEDAYRTMRDAHVPQLLVVGRRGAIIGVLHWRDLVPLLSAPAAAELRACVEAP